jgi:tetratricopeptide (TPR) repeat protein
LTDPTTVTVGGIELTLPTSYSPLVADRLRPLWDFDDLDASERRFLAQLADEASDVGRAEVLSQLARVEGLRGRLVEADALLDEARSLDAESLEVRARLDLERGRVRRSGGEPEAALALFESAFSTAVAAREDFLAADAAHMAALTAGDREAMLVWTQRGIELAETSDEAAYWAGPLLNNLGWAHYEAGEHREALEAFERALAARERAGDPATVEIARYAVGKTLRALDRPAEAVVLLERCVEWTESTSAPDGWFHEELAECYAALGRDADAGQQARLALPLLERDDPSFADGTERAARLQALATA